MEDREEMYKSLDYQVGEMMGARIWERMCHLQDNFDGTMSKYSSMGEEEIQDPDLPELFSLSKLRGKCKTNEEKLAWNAWLRLFHVIEARHLPNPFTFSDDILDLKNINNMDWFKQGIIGYLWNTDFCPYSLHAKPFEVKVNECKYRSTTDYIFHLSATSEGHLYEITEEEN